MIVKDTQPIGFFAKADIGFTKDKVYVRKFDHLGICYYERHFSDWHEAQDKFDRIKNRGR